MNKIQNILFTVGWPIGQGGHIQSLYNILKELKKRNIAKKIYLIGPNGPKVKNFKDIGINYIPYKNHKNEFVDFLFFSFQIFKIIIIKRINLIHAMDYRSLKPVIISNLFGNIKMVFTKAGGPPDNFNLKYPKVSAIIVYSKELLNNFYETQSHFSKRNIFLIKERIVIKSKKVLQKKSNKIVIAMRFDNIKKKMLDNLFDELKVLNPTKPIKLILCGKGPLMKHYIKVSEKIHNMGISLPSSPEITPSDIFKTCNVIRSLIK